MINHMHASKCFPEAYNGKISRGDISNSIVEVATERELATIVARYGDWAITVNGIECLSTSYSIGKERFDESDWEEHVGAKSWVNRDDFINALNHAKELVKLNVIKV
ncbi:MAG: hypothetical protein QM493_05340 [Sulfurovum sp.]